MSKTLRGRIFRYALALIALGIISLLTLFLLVLNGYYGPLPEKEELRGIINSEGTEVVDRNGVILGKFYIQDRSNLSPDQIPDLVKKTLVQIEDRRYYEHNGIDFRSLGRVFFKSILLNDASSGGGSTISQQLAKNIYPRVDHPYLYYVVNKMREMLIARRLEEIYSKDEILALYLNTVSFGLDSYGIEATSVRIFGKSASELGVSEIATLVGMLKATTSYHPLLNPQRSRERRDLILAELARAEIISQPLADSLSNIGMITNPVSTKKREALYFLDRVRSEVESILKDLDQSLNLKTDGLKIETTLDINLQRYAEKAIATHLSYLQKKFQEQLTSDFWDKNKVILEIEQDKLKLFDPVPKREMSVFTWEGDTLVTFTQTDSLKHYLQFLQAGLLATDPTTGEILSWVGGIDPVHFAYDHVVSKRQVGSTIKPLIYAAALENEISPCEYYETERVNYVVEGEDWSPSNSGNVDEEHLTMATALEKSVNTVTVKILEDVGIKRSIELMRASGITSEIPQVPSIALGTPSISLLEMVDSYGAICNLGKRAPLHFIKRITDGDGQVIYEGEIVLKEVMEKRTAQLMTQFLREVANNGTGSELRSKYGISNDIGGKTGTSQNNADGWFIGISPRLNVGVWVGGEYPAISFSSSEYGQGARMALPVYAHFYRQLNRDSRYKSVSQARFPTLNQELASEIDCDPFREEFQFWNWLRSLRGKQIIEGDSLTKKPRLLDRVKGLFDRKRKNR